MRYTISIWDEKLDRYVRCDDPPVQAYDFAESGKSGRIKVKSKIYRISQHAFATNFALTPVKDKPIVVE